VAAKNDDIPPNNITKNNAVGANSNIGEHLIIRKIPAVTNVAECINADTGVGPSIASGSHVCNPICDDFPIEPINKNIHIRSRQYISISNKKIVVVLNNGVIANITEKSADLK
jgi:hypothetical protein